MLTMFNQKWKNCSGEYWLDFFKKHKADREKFARNEVVGLVYDKEAICYAEIDWDKARKHLADPDIDAHIQNIGETTQAYELRAIEDCPDGHSLWFGHFTFENETPQEWIAHWQNDKKRLTKNEKFAIVDNNNVLVIAEGGGNSEQAEAHRQREDVRSHIERTNETSQIWGATLL